MCKLTSEPCARRRSYWLSRAVGVPGVDRRAIEQTRVCVEIDVMSGRMTLAGGKRESYAKLARSAAAERVCERSSYESLMGKLTFAATCYPMGRQWLHAPWRAARASPPRYTSAFSADADCGVFMCDRKKTAGKSKKQVRAPRRRWRGEAFGAGGLTSDAGPRPKSARGRRTRVPAPCQIGESLSRIIEQGTGTRTGRWRAP